MNQMQLGENGLIIPSWGKAGRVGMVDLKRSKKNYRCRKRHVLAAKEMQQRREIKEIGGAMFYYGESDGSSQSGEGWLRTN